MCIKFERIASDCVVSELLDIRDNAEEIRELWNQAAEENGWPQVFYLDCDNLQDEVEDMTAWDIIERFGGINLKDRYCTTDIYGEAQSSSDILDLVDLDELTRWICEKGFIVSYRMV